jgi:hypothetical protein
MFVMVVDLVRAYLHCLHAGFGLCFGFEDLVVVVIGFVSTTVHFFVVASRTTVILGCTRSLCCKC